MKDGDGKNIENFKSEDYLLSVINGLPTGLIVLNSDDCTIKFVNKNIEKYFNVSNDEIKGTNVHTSFPFLSDIKEKNRIRFSKNERIYSVIVERIKINGSHEAMIQIEDITTYVEMENKVREMKKMDTLSSLARGFAHNFNNILNIIIGSIDIITETEDDKKRAEYLGKIKYATKEAKDLVEIFHIFAKTDRDAYEEITAREVIVNTLDTVRKSLKDNIDIKISLNPIINKKLFADSYLLTMAFFHIIKNAIESIEPDKPGIIRITGNIVKHNGKEFLEIKIEDNGGGMTQEDIERVYEPFFTTKGMEKSRGAGLGMALVYNIIKQHDGMIDIKSALGKGTTVKVLLPVV